jgi:hypothetical protein
MRIATLLHDPLPFCCSALRTGSWMTDAERAEAFEKFWQDCREKAVDAVIKTGWRSAETVEEVAREAFYAGVGTQS